MAGCGLEHLGAQVVQTRKQPPVLHELGLAAQARLAVRADVARRGVDTVGVVSERASDLFTGQGSKCNVRRHGPGPLLAAGTASPAACDAPGATGPSRLLLK